MELTRADNDREAWCCPRCAGTALGVGDLIDDLLEVAPHLRPADGVRDLVTIGRRAATELACPACGQAMEPGYLAAFEIERCRGDNLFWLDRGDREAIVARAAVQPRPGLFEHLQSILVGRPTDGPQVSRATRIVRVISAIAIITAIPLGLFGARLLWLGHSGERVFDLSTAFLAIEGAIVLFIATILFLAGGILFVRLRR